MSLRLIETMTTQRQRISRFGGRSFCHTPRPRGRAGTCQRNRTAS